MSDEQPSDVLGALPRTRPHRRSDKRGSPRAETTPPERDNGAPPEQTAHAPEPADDTPAPAAAPAADAPAPAADDPTGPEQLAAAAKAPSARARKPTAKKTTAPKQRSARASEPSPQARPRLRQPPQPAGTPSRAPDAKPIPARGTDLLGTAVQAAAELAEIGLSLSARAVRSAVSKLPRP
jgi:hypothetical protein